MPSPDQHKKTFIKAFNGIAYDMQRHDVFRDFIELAFSAIAKTTTTGEAADNHEARYMAIVKRHKPDDIRKMPELLAITQIALAEGGCDFLGNVIGELELLNKHLGQFFSPYSLSRLMAELQLSDVGSFIKERGFFTVQEPACGAGGMILAAADVVTGQGFDIGHTMYADCTDISPQCFHMAYMQLSLRGIPAMVRRGDTLRMQFSESVMTPALVPFMIRNGNPFAGQEFQQQAGATNNPLPPDRPKEERARPMEQMSLF